jgi:HK97 family phage portal protein
MKFRDLFRTDPTYRDPFQVETKAQFDFLPTDTSAWPMATFAPGLIDAARLGELGSSSYSHIYRSQPSVYTVVEFLAWQISQIGLKVYERQTDGEKVPRPESEVQRLINEPAPGLTYERWLHSTVADVCVYGNGYQRKMERGGERALIPIRPALVEPHGGNLLEAEEYWVTSGGEIVKIPAAEVLHFRRHNPDDLRLGVSPLEPLRSVLREEYEASADRVGFWRNSARVGGVLRHPGALSDEAYERLATSFSNQRTGWRNSGKTVILEEGADFQTGMFSPKDSEFIAGRKLTLETVARAYNVPISVLGLSDTATYASQKEFHKALYQDTLGPWLKMLEGEIVRAVVRWIDPNPNLFVEFNIAEKLKGSFEEQADALRAWVGVPPMSPNEWRARYNLPKIDDERFDLPVMPANVVYGGVEPPGEAPPTEDPELTSTPVVPIRQTNTG